MYDPARFSRDLAVPVTHPMPIADDATPLAPEQIAARKATAQTDLGKIADALAAKPTTPKRDLYAEYQHVVRTSQHSYSPRFSRHP